MSAGREIRVIAFPGAPNLPIFAAEELGFFKRENLAVAFSATPSSSYQAEKLAQAQYEIACTAFDNVVAYSEGQGAANIEGDPGFCVLMGATQLEVALVATPDVRSIADLKGRSVALDAVATGFAFIFYDMLDRNSLTLADCKIAPVGATPQRWNAVKEGEHAATLTIEPFTSIARKAGFNVLGVTTDLYPSYQGGIVASTRSWTSDHPDETRRFIRGYLAGLSWTLDPANRADAEALLLRHMDQIPPQAVKPVMDSLLSPRSGLTPNGELLPDGMRQVLSLRSRYGGGKEELVDWRKYVDLSYYNDAVA